MGREKDLRVARTEKHLKQALFRLLWEKPLEKITVKELALQAEVSRATFYLYYDSLETMVSSVEDEIFQEFSDEICAIAARSKDYYGFIRTALRYTLDSTLSILPFARLIYAGKAGGENLRRCIELICSTSVQMFRNPAEAERYRSYFLFQTNGITAVIRSWLMEEDVKTPPDVLTDRIMDMLLNGRKLCDEIASLTKRR